MSRSRLEPLLLAALLFLVAGVCLVRGVGLLRDPHRMDAHDERGWLPWALPRTDAAALFAEAAESLDPGEVVCLRVPQGEGVARWFRFMAHYYLPAQQVVRVEPRGGARFPPQATVVVIRASGEVQVRKGGGRGQPG